MATQAPLPASLPAPGPTADRQPLPEPAHRFPPANSPFFSSYRHIEPTRPMQELQFDDQVSKIQKIPNSSCSLQRSTDKHCFPSHSSGKTVLVVWVCGTITLDMPYSQFMAEVTQTTRCGCVEKRSDRTTNTTKPMT